MPGTVYGLSRKGWIDGDLFDLWFSRHFLAHAPPMWPLFLLMDGHASHFQPHVIETAAKEGVIMFCLPPHSSHLTQPLDKGCFGPLKVHWREEGWSFITAHPGCVVTRYHFSDLFRRAWMKGITMQNITGGFHATGVYPFDRLAVSVSKDAERISLAERTGLQFIPLCSPAHRKPDKATGVVLHFSAEEIARFQVRWDEGYDLPDQRYEKWVRIYHPRESTHGSSSPLVDSDSSSQLSSTPEKEDSFRTPPRSSVLAHILTEQAPTLKYSQPQVTSFASRRVLTSSEKLLHLQEKERKKKEKVEEMQRRKKNREQ